MAFKYEQQITEMKCTLTEHTAREHRLFCRWVFEDITDKRNFLPQYVIHSEFKQTQCIGWALSFHATQLQSIDKFKRILKDKENAYKKLGNYVATGYLEKVDGISDNENEEGHFSHFEYEGIELNKKELTLEKLVDWND